MNPQAYWSSLDAAWKKFLTSEFEVDGPTKVKKLAREREVYLDEKFASATLEPLAAFEKLEELNCDAPKVNDLTPLTSLPRFESLRISSKALKDFSPIAKLPKLRSLDVSETAFTDLSVVSKLAFLRQLNVSDTKVDDLAPLSGMKKLENLELGGTKVTDLTALSGSKRLEDLDLTNLKLASFAPLSKLQLRRLTVYGTNVKDLAFLTSPVLHFLDVRKTAISFREVLAVLKRIKDDDGMLFSDFEDEAAVLAALNHLDFPLEGLEAMLGALVHNAITSSLKKESPAEQQLAVKLLSKWVELPVSKVKHEYAEKLAGNAVVTLVRLKCPEPLVKATLALLPDEVTDKVLAFNLACLFAGRKDKAQLLRYAKVALANGQEPTRFREDADFAGFLNDPDFQKLLQAPQLPDPETETQAWWNKLPEELRDTLANGDTLSSDLDESKSNIFKAIHAKDFSISYSYADTLDHLRGLIKLKRLDLSEVRARSIEPLGTLVGLEYLKFGAQKKDQAFDWSPLSACVKLKSLSVSRGLFDLSKAAALPKLTELKLWYTTVSSLESLKSMTQLTSLQLAIDGEATIEATWLAPLTRLTSLDVRNLDSLEPLKGLKKLTNLDVEMKSATPVSLAPLSSLTGLTNLSLTGCTFTDATPLLALKSLRYVRLSKEAPVAAVKKLFKAQLPACEVRV